MTYIRMRIAILILVGLGAIVGLALNNLTLFYFVTGILSGMVIERYIQEDKHDQPSSSNHRR